MGGVVARLLGAEFTVFNARAFNSICVALAGLPKKNGRRLAADFAFPLCRPEPGGWNFLSLLAALATFYSGPFGVVGWTGRFIRKRTLEHE